MVLSEEKEKEYVKRIILSRMRILQSNGFYGLLLMHLLFSVDETVERAATDGEKIYFNPEFLDIIDDELLDFVLMHELLHIVLKHCFRKGDRDQKLFDVACDIVVNSTILNSTSSYNKPNDFSFSDKILHLAPNGKEGYRYTVEQVYEMLEKDGKKANKNGDNDNDSSKSEKKTDKANGNCRGEEVDDHSKWETKDANELEEVWNKRFIDAAESIKAREGTNIVGLLPMFAQRMLEELTKPQIDWRLILNDFVQEEVVDYSFSPPDRRFDDYPFYLPDFNEKEDSVKDILFMIDTSGSITNKMMTVAYSEIKGAIDQFGGKLQGWLGFFDATVKEPIPFEGEDEFKKIKPTGGGGTRFDIIFHFVKNNMMEKPVSIVILTDGYATFPKESSSMEIPVLWMINNEDINPPWGKVARIKV